MHWTFLHEIGHIRRGDLLWSWAFLILRALHWFNPLVWLAEHRTRIDQEMACDEWVLAQNQASSRTEYGEAILRTAQQAGPSQNSHYVHAGMAESGSGLTTRIRHLARAYPRGVWAAAITLLLGVAVVLLLSPGRKNAPQEVSSEISQQGPALSPDENEVIWVEIEPKFLEVTPEAAEEIFGKNAPDTQTILSDENYQKLLRRMNQRKGIDLVSAPRVTTKVNQRATIKVARELRYPSQFNSPDQNNLQQVTPKAFETKDLGLTLEVEPSLTPDHLIVCSLRPRMTELLGFVNYGEGPPGQTLLDEDAITAALQVPAGSNEVINQPVFRTREMQTTVVLHSGETVMLAGSSRQTTKTLLGDVIDSPGDHENHERILYTFVTARLVDSSNMKTLRPTNTPATSPAPNAKSNLPYGSPVPSKPGFVTSPHAPNKGWVDVRGVPSGTEVKCPYSGKMFLVP